MTMLNSTPCPSWCDIDHERHANHMRHLTGGSLVEGSALLVERGERGPYGPKEPHISIGAYDHDAGKHAGTYVSVFAAAGLADVFELTGDPAWLVAALREAVELCDAGRPRRRPSRSAGRANPSPSSSTGSSSSSVNARTFARISSTDA